MRRLGATSILVLICAMPAAADDMPSRKAGLWEVKMNVANRNNVPGQVIKQCIDASTDHLMQSSAGPFAEKACSKRDVQKSGDKITIDSTCMIGGKTATSHAVIAGSFDSAYDMTVTSQAEGIPNGGMTMTMSAKWLGPCAADQKPGDMVMGNGMKINILDMQKRAGLFGAPGAPSTPFAPR